MSSITVNTASNNGTLMRDSSKALSVWNDIFALLFVSGLNNYNEYQIIFWPITFMFFALTFINAYINKRKLTIFFVWAIIFGTYCILTGLWTNYPAPYRSLAIVMVRITLTLCFTSLYVSDEKKAHTLLYGFLIGALVLAVRIMIYTPLDDFGTVRLGKAIGLNVNSVGASMLWGAIICLYLSHKNRLLLILFLFLSIFAFLTGSKKVFFLFFLVIAVFFLDKIDKPEKIIYLVPLILAIYLIYYASFNNAYLYNIIGHRIEIFFQVMADPDNANERGSTYVRMDLINIGLDVFLQKPITGHGLGSFQALNKYHTYAHNNYVELLACTGIIGTVLYYIMSVSLMIKTTAIRMAKDKRITIFLLFMLVQLIQDVGAVRFYGELNAITLAVTYSMVSICLTNRAPSLDSER